MKALESYPVSLLAFFFAAVLYALQTIPEIGIFFMLLGAPLWTGLLVTVGMVGLAIEVPFRTYKLTEDSDSLNWLIIPVAYFGLYGAFALKDHLVLLSLRFEYDSANASVTIPFDPDKNSLVFLGGADGYSAALTQNYSLPVAYNHYSPDGYISTRIIEKEECTVIGKNLTARAASIRTFGISANNRSDSLYSARRFCSLRMPEMPSGEVLSVESVNTETSVMGLPIKPVETVLTMANGSKAVLRGGTAAPYFWFPLPVLGCALNSGEPSWECVHGFSRGGFTQIVSSDTKYGGDVNVLAEALGLKTASPANLQLLDSAALAELVLQAVDRQLEQDVADLRESVADPANKMTVHSIRVLSLTPEAIVDLSPLIVEGIERAAQITDNPYRYRATGLNLARLFGKLPFDVQESYAVKITELYRLADEANDGRHWLYQADTLIRYRKPTT